MSEKNSDFGNLNIIGRMEYFKRLVEDGTDQEQLGNLIRSADPKMEEIVFNVINQLAGSQMTEELYGRLVWLGNERCEFLKSRFPKGKGVSREYPGKMEYDTTMEVLKTLEKNR